MRFRQKSRQIAMKNAMLYNKKSVIHELSLFLSQSGGIRNYPIFFLKIPLISEKRVNFAF